MGTEEKDLAGQIYFVDPETGAHSPLTFQDGEIPDITVRDLCSVEMGVYMGELPEEQCVKISEAIKDGVTINFDVPWWAIPFGKLSRKRFVKLMMSIGVSRNEANRIAAGWRSWTRGAPYFVFAPAIGIYCGYKTRLGNCRYE